MLSEMVVTWLWQHEMLPASKVCIMLCIPVNTSQPHAPHTRAKGLHLAALHAARIPKYNATSVLTNRR